MGPIWKDFVKTLHHLGWCPGEPKVRNICTIQLQESVGAGLLGRGSGSGICLICFREALKTKKLCFLGQSVAYTFRYYGYNIDQHRIGQRAI